MSDFPLVLQLVLAAVAVVAGVWDLRTRRIPNWLVLTGLLLGFLLNGFLFLGPGLVRSALGFGLALLIYFPMYLLRGMGAGDVKLMAALGAIAGWQRWIGIFIVSGILGGILAVLLTLARGRLRTTLWNVGFILSELAHFRAPHLTRAELNVDNPKAVTLPHGTVIALGVVVLLILIRLFPA
jgi:prepilin peptidase CpaA